MNEIIGQGAKRRYFDRGQEGFDAHCRNQTMLHQCNGTKQYVSRNLEGTESVVDVKRSLRVGGWRSASLPHH